MSPRSATGAKTADRAPTATRRSPRRRRRQASARSPSESALCSTATWSPKAPRRRLTVCGVSPISGTSTMAPRPRRQHPANRLQVDQRLAAAGHPEEQGGAARLKPLDRRQRLGLWRGERVGRGHRGHVGERVAHPLHALDPREPLRREARDHRLGEPELVHHVPYLGVATQGFQRFVEAAALAAPAEQGVPLQQGRRLAREHHHALRRHRRLGIGRHHPELHRPDPREPAQCIPERAAELAGRAGHRGFPALLLEPVEHLAG